MAHYRATIETAQPREDVFAYLSDFSNTKEWDPGVVVAERLGGSAIGQGTEFRLAARLLGRTATLTYRIVEFDPPRSVAFRGENATVVSFDRVTLDETAGGTRVAYDADLRLRGALALADPLLTLAFRRVGDRALAGLRRTLVPVQPRALRALEGRALDGRDYVLPGALPRPINLLAIAFRRDHQRLVDTWLPWLSEIERCREDVGVYEVPVLSALYSPARSFIDGGMARAIADRSARAGTITVYTDVHRVQRDLRLEGTDTIAIVALERTGRILACEIGGFDARKAERLAAALPPAVARPASAA